MLAARAVFTEKGYNDALISDIAERAGVVEGSIYRFFTNKRDLLVRVVEHWYEEMLARDDEQFASVRGTWNKIPLHHPSPFAVDPPRAGAEPPGVPGIAARSRITARRTCSSSTRPTRIASSTWSRQPSPKANCGDVSPALVRDMIYGCIEHRTWAFLRNEGDFEIDDTADGITDIVYRGSSPSGRARSCSNTRRASSRSPRLETLADNGSQSDS